uniref:Tyrosinase_Cu-bd domain-containing protein n=1 Tax=Haemonchus contortus TaxID=6289 RepID=A0A7I4YIC8_HAECO
MKSYPDTIHTVVWLITVPLLVLCRTPSELSPLRNRPCHQLPVSGFLTVQQLDLICHHREQWIKDSEAVVSKTSLDETTDDQKSYLRELEACTRMNCAEIAGKRRRKKRETKKSIRREIRMVSAEERQRLWKAMNALKETTIDNITVWDLHTLVHYPDSAPGAHWGPAFLPWHREFLRQFEVALQNEDPSVSLPYWDSTLDQGLPEPSDSVMWSDELLGNGNGYVKTGPFKNWDTNVLMPLSQIPVKKLYRSTGGREQDRLLTPRDIEWITSRKNYSQLTFCHDKTFESMHGLSHVWVGGFMFVIRVSPNDPMFYLHHAFVDYLWEQFRRKQQTPEQRETQWAKDTCNSLHGYDYEPVRHCNASKPDCDSPYYWCDMRAWRCRSKVVLGGNCTGFEGTGICYNSACRNNRCQLPPRLLQSMRSRKSADPPSGDYVWTKTLLIDQNGKGVHDDLAHVKIMNQITGENSTAYLQSEPQYPEIDGIVYLPIPKPRAGMIQEVSLEARDGFGRYCQAHCYNETEERYQVCQPKMKVGIRAESSSPLSYTHSMTSRRFLDVDLSVHPRQVVISAPFIVFACSRKLMTSTMITSLAENTRPPPSREPYVWFRVAVHSRLSQNLQIEVAPTSGKKWSSLVRKAASPFDPNLVFVQAPNPEISSGGGVQVTVSILEDGTRIKCITKCTQKDGSVHDCNGTVDLHSDPALSQEDVFTTDQGALHLLGWNMRGHPAQWRHKVPYLSFTC